MSSTTNSSARDLSNTDGAPVYLYEFTRVSTPTLTGVPVMVSWRYTSADRDIVYNDNTFVAVPIVDDGIRQSGDATADQLSITMPITLAIPQMFLGSAPSDPIQARIGMIHYGETDAFLLWAGNVGASSIHNDGLTATVICNTISATLDRSGVRLSWSRQCPHTLYDSECRVDPRNFHVNGTILVKDGVNIQANAWRTTSNSTPGTLFPGQLAGGFVELIDSNGQAERRGILLHSIEGAIRLLGGTDKFEVGMLVSAFNGCAHTRTACQGFSNIDNYGGHAYMPSINPFSGDPIF